MLVLKLHSSEMYFCCVFPVSISFGLGGNLSSQNQYSLKLEIAFSSENCSAMRFGINKSISKKEMHQENAFNGSNASRN